jgi:hypothetical protein
MVLVIGAVSLSALSGRLLAAPIGITGQKVFNLLNKYAETTGILLTIHNSLR